MGDRYSDRYDSYDDEYGYGSRSGDRYSSSRSDRSRYRSSGSYSDSGQRRSTGSSARRLSQSSDARYSSSSSNVFEDFYPENDDIDFYRRSSYGSGASRRSSASRQNDRFDTYYDSGSRNRTSRRVSHTSPTPRASAERGPERRRYSDSLENQGSRRNSARVPNSPRRSASVSRSGRVDREDRSRDEVEYAPKRSNRKRNLIIAAVVVVAVILVGAGAAFAYVNSISSNLHEGVDEDLKSALVETDMANEPFYMLLMGVDTAEWRLEQQSDIADTVRSDSMMLTRVDPVNKKVALISIHRDTMVDLGENGEQKINAAYQYGGAAGAVEAVSKLAGVPISHYASVDLDGFTAIVDSIGGVEVDVPIDIDDPEAGGQLSAGLQTLNGAQATILCRSRHSYDDLAGDGDVMRAANQRMVLSAIAKKILSSDVLTIANTVQVLSRYVTTDLEISDIIGLAQIMQGIDPNADIYTAMEPTQSAYIDETWYEYLDEDAWSEMIKRMDQGLPPVNKTEIDDATGTVLSTGGADAPVV